MIKNVMKLQQTMEEINRELDKLSKVLRENMDINYIYKIMGLD